MYDTPPERMRLKLSASGDSAGLLDRTLAEGERIEVQPAASAHSGRVPLKLNIIGQGRIITSGAATAEVLIERECVSTTVKLERDEVLLTEMLVVQTAWLSPSAATPLPLDQAVGKLAVRRLPAGEVIDATDVASPIVVRKGDEVTVRCFVGSIGLETRAYALADGRIGDTVPMALDKTKERRPFSAVITGRARAERVDAAMAFEREGPGPANEQHSVRTSKSKINR